MIFFALALALLALIVSLSLAKRVSALEQTNPLQGPALQALVPEPVLDAPSPLEGLRVSVSIRQDYSLPLVENLLKELLQKEDANLTGPPELVIEGDVTCNGYAEVYYTAELTCLFRGDPICNLIERPPHGDRPLNLAIELVTRLKTELAKDAERRDRRQAISELQGP